MRWNGTVAGPRSQDGRWGSASACVSTNGANPDPFMIDKSGRNKLDVAFWATVVVVVLVILALYPLSLGPIIWLGNHGDIPEEMGPALLLIYWPLLRYTHVDEVGGEELGSVGKAVVWYIARWME